MVAGSDDPESYVNLRLPARPESASAARRFIAKTLAGWGLASLIDTAVLLGNELVTNALVHARSAVEVELVRERSSLRVAVHDTAASLPRRRFYGPEADSGRGLAMVEALAAGWGVTPAMPVGKAVWFELGMPGVATAARVRLGLGRARPVADAGAGATG